MDSRVGPGVSAFNGNSLAEAKVVSNCKLPAEVAPFMMRFTLSRLTPRRGGRRFTAARNHKMLCQITGDQPQHLGSIRHCRSGLTPHKPHGNAPCGRGSRTVAARIESVRTDSFGPEKRILEDESNYEYGAP